MRFCWRGCCLFALLTLSAVVSAQSDYPGMAVRINGHEISYERFNAFYQEYLRQQHINITLVGDPKRLTKMRREAMNMLVEQELVSQAAEAKKVEVPTDEIDKAIDEMRSPFDKEEDFIDRLKEESYTLEEYREHLRRMYAAGIYLDQIRAGVEPITDQQLEEFYRNNEYRLTLPEEVRVRHILLTWKPLGTTDDRATLRKQMQEILEQARGGADFVELAKTRSEDSTSHDGGDTGFFHRGELVPAFEDTAFALQPGEISDIVETPFGLHIMRLEDRHAPHLLPLDEVRDKLRDYIYEERMKTAVQQEIARLRQAAEIQELIPL